MDVHHDVAHNLVVQLLALLAHCAQDAKHGVFVAARQPGRGAYAAALSQAMNDLDNLGVIQADAGEGVKVVEGAVAVFTAVTLDDAALISEAPEFLNPTTTMRAVHFCSRLSLAES